MPIITVDPADTSACREDSMDAAPQQCHISGMPAVDSTEKFVGMMSEVDLVRWHEGYIERQARWLDVLADGFELAPAILEGIHKQRRKVRSVSA
jgi:hypothetical protein